MKQTFKLEFITPTFLSGAEQNRAELRVPSIKGELRWWFRVLGANNVEEREVFGGIAKNEQLSSKVIIRIRDIEEYHEDLPRFSQMSDFGYIYYFATVSGETKGDRVKKQAFFAPGTKFVMDILERPANPIPTEISRQRLALAILCFIRLGALGLRSTRGCGALCEPDNLLSEEDFLEWGEQLPKSIIVKGIDNPTKTWKECQEKLGAYLREFRRSNNLSGQSESALGFSNGRERESSALHLRPVKVKEGYFPIIVYSDAACSQPSIRGKLDG